MDKLQAKQMLKQVDCHGIPRGYNGNYSDLYVYCLKSIEKLEQIEKIVKDSGDFKGENTAHDKYVKIAEIILEQE